MSKKLKKSINILKRLLLRHISFRSNMKPTNIDYDDLLDVDGGVELFNLHRFIVAIISFLMLFFVWSLTFEITEVSKGNGKVIPGSKEKIIQSLDGGVLQHLYVKEGQVVKYGAVLAQLDITRTSSTFDEQESKYHSLLAKKSLLAAEANDSELLFPMELEQDFDLKSSTRKLFQSRKIQLLESLKNINESRQLINKELSINLSLVNDGAASSADIIRLRRQLVELNTKETELRANYYLKSREDLEKISSEISSLKYNLTGRKDYVEKSTLKSPVRGIIKDIQVNTIGGVIPPNGILMNIVPLDDTLIIETKISPRDIAFIHPNQTASVKITAYDYSIYGDLRGVVTSISPDTIKDESKNGELYYRVYIQTNDNFLLSKNGRRLFISPGMIASVDIVTGKKTIFKYLIKPFNKLNEALRER